MDGTGASARFSGPVCIVVDSQGNLHVGELGNYAIRRVTPAGVVTTVVSGNFPGTASLQVVPVGMAVDEDAGYLVVTDQRHAISVVTFDGVVTTIAGLLNSAGAVNGTGSTARINNPGEIVGGGGGVYYFVDGSYTAIRMLTIP